MVDIGWVVGLFFFIFIFGCVVVILGFCVFEDCGLGSGGLLDNGVVICLIGWCILLIVVVGVDIFCFYIVFLVEIGCCDGFICFFCV